MQHPETRTVTLENGPRPAGKPDECFYCHAPLGAPHHADCVCRERTVVIRYTIDVISRVPESWLPKDINFHRNDSSWCASNLIPDLEQPDCLCPFMDAIYLREASADDERDWSGASPAAEAEKGTHG